MAGLNLIQEYSSDTEEEMEKSNEENKTFFNVEKSNLKLPLPESILTLKGVSHHEEVVDNPLEHEGRIRSFKHERGNWATLLYIDYIPSEDLFLWMKSIEQIIESGKLFEEFHVSLTKTLLLKFHWIDSFVEAIKNITRSYQSFVMELNNIKVYCNEDKTRTFIGITIQSTNDSLPRLTETIDELLNEYQLPLFYEDASYHISFFWCLGDQRNALETQLPRLILNFHNFLTNHPEQRYLQVNQLKCKIGNKYYNFKLR